MVDSIKITALQDIGANIAYTTLVPVVNMAGTPTTQKSNLQNLGNLILNGAGGSYFPRAAQATLALSVANAAQPNITSVGTLTSLAVTGNITAGNINGGNIVVANFYYGDGGFLTNVASGSNYSNSNVANYLPTFTGNVGANWVIASYFMGNGHNLTYLPGANVQGFVANANVANTALAVAAANVSGLGNVALINLDGNSSNVLRGNGSWGPDANSSYGNGNVANYLPTYTGNIGANVITNSANLTIQTDTGNANVRWVFGAGGALYWPSVPGGEWAIEPNGDGEFEIHSHTNVVISTDSTNSNYHFTFDSSGSLSFPTNNLYINGDTSLFGSNSAIIQTGSNVPLALITDGPNSSLDTIWLSNIADYANANIAAIYVNPSAATGAIRVVTGNNASNTYIWDFDGNGLLTLPDGAIIDTTGNNFEVRAVENVNFEANSVVNIYTDGSNNAYQWQFGDDGNLTLPTNGSIIVDGGDGVIGPVSDDLVISWDNEEIRLVSVQASIEMQADAAFRVQTNYDGANVLYASRWEFNQNEIVNISNNFGIVSEAGNLNLSGGRDGVNSGNTTISAVDTGVAVSTWTFDNTGNLTLPGNSFAVNYANGTPVSIGGGGNTGNVTFDDVTVQGVNGLNLSAGADFTANLAYLQVRAGDVPSHIHLDTGNNEAYDLIVGDDQNYVQVSSTGNILLSSYDSNTAQYTWTLDYNGNLTLAGGNGVIQSVANSSLDPLNPNVSTMILTPDANYNSQALILDPTAPGHIHLRAPGANIDEPAANLFLGGEDSSFEVGYYTGTAPNVFIHSNSYTWTFDTTGNLNTGNIIFDTAGRHYIYYGSNNYINLYNDGGMDLSCNTEIKITTNYGDSPNRAYSYFYANGTFSAGGNITTSANVSGDVGLFNDLNLNNAGTNAFLYTDSNRNIYDTQFSYDSANDSMSGGNISLTGNISANNLGNISGVNLDGSSSNVLYGNGVFAQPASIPFVLANANITANINTSYQVLNSVGNANINFTLPDGNGLAAGSFVKINPYDQSLGNFAYFVVTNGANSAGIQGLAAPLSANRPTTIVWGGSFWYYSN